VNIEEELIDVTTEEGKKHLKYLEEASRENLHVSDQNPSK
jgi:hypothetical protein